MPRFDRLELDPSQDKPDDQGGGRDEQKLRDEHHWLRLAETERRHGLYENALRFYSRSLELDKSQVTGWLGQVQMLIALGEQPEAELWARKALELFKNHGDLLAGRAQALCRMKDRTQALACCDAALAQSGHSAYRWIVRGEVMVLTGSDVDRYCFDKAVQLDGDWLVPLEIAQAYLHHGYPGKALARARQAVEKGADQSYPWYFLGLCERELDLREAARRSFHRCLEIVPNHADAQRNLIELDQQGWSLVRTLRRLFRRC
jgi:tetratricopeptide (TPR) repeat protein